MPPRPQSSASTTRSASHTDLSSHADFKDLADTDFVVQTSDGSKFPVLRAVLAANSLVLRDALKSDEGASEKDEGASEKDEQGRPILTMPDEKAEDVELFLRFLVPELKRPTEPTSDQFFTILRLAKKYHCPLLSEQVKSHHACIDLFNRDPARTFGFAAADGDFELAQRNLEKLNFVAQPSLLDVSEYHWNQIDPYLRCQLFRLQLSWQRANNTQWSSLKLQTTKLLKEHLI